MNTPKILVSVFAAITGALAILVAGMIDAPYAFGLFGVVMTWCFGLHIFQEHRYGQSERLRWTNIVSAAIMVGMSFMGMICAIMAAIDGDRTNGICFAIIGALIVVGGTVVIATTKLQPANQPS